jgi:gamma-glutamyltranspeptidase / glutathione hydrolase
MRRVISPSRPELKGTFGMVASTHWLASAAGMSVLERGGNAFDAAAAAGFVLQVVEPHLNGPGGEVPIILWSQRDQRVDVVCGQGVAPRSATCEHLASLGLAMVPGTGLLPAVVPGAFGAWMLMLERWGTWRLHDVLQYAIDYARNGFPALPAITSTVAEVAPLFEEHWTSSAQIWLNGGNPPRVGSKMRSAQLATTFERLITEAQRQRHDRDGQLRAAVDIWYRGFVAEAIVKFCHGQPWMDTSGHMHRGLLDSEDLANWQASVEPPATLGFGEYTVCKTGAWGQGPVMLQQLALLDALDIRSVPYGSADYFHLMIEVAKLAYADREAWYGDSGTIPDLVQHLLDPRYTFERSRLVGPAASLQLRPGSIDGQVPILGAPEGMVDGEFAWGQGEPTMHWAQHPRTGDTCHIDVVDRHGNMVSATPSGGWLQSSPAIPELGFCLTTRGQMFSLDPRHPNALRPGARPRTTLTPSLVVRDAKPWMAFGTPGGDGQDQWNLAFFCSVVLGGLDLQTAIEAPAFSSEHFPSSFYPRRASPGRVLFESRISPDIVENLRRRGHEVVLTDEWSLGRLSAVTRDAGDGFLRAAANPRGAQGYAVGR